MPVAVVNGRSVLFVHIPKTGGSSVERYLSRHGSVLLQGNGRDAGLRCSAQHLHAEALASIDAADGHDWSFTIVRHPVARLVSEYRYQMRKPGWLRSRLSFAGWLSLAWFFAPHCDIRIDGLREHEVAADGTSDSTTLLAQLHLYL